MREETGIALVTAVGVLGVLSLAGGTVIAVSSANARSAEYSSSNGSADSLAEAGLANALSVLNNAPDPLVPTLLPSTTVALDGGTASFSGTLSGNTWTITSTGAVPNPTGPGAAPIQQTANVQAIVSASQNLLANNPAWRGLSAFGSASCPVAVGETSRVRSPVYVVGNLCLEDTARIESSAGTVTVTGTLRLFDSSQVGTSGAPLPTLHVGVGCQASGPVAFPCTPTQRVWVTSQDQVVTPALSKPPLDVAYWYANAKPGPSQNCTTGSFPGGFDNDSALNTSLGSVNILPASSYDCTVTSGGQTVGRIAWNNSTKAFTIQGTVFFDGNLSMSGSQQATYTGRGTIYFSGAISLGGSDQLCAVRSGSSCNFTPGAWDPETALLALVAGSSSGSGSGLTIQSNVQFQGALYSVGPYVQRNSTQVQGPIVSDRVDIKDSAQVSWSDFTTLAPGMPASSSAPATVSVVAGSWTPS